MAEPSANSISTSTMDATKASKITRNQRKRARQFEQREARRSEWQAVDEAIVEVARLQTLRGDGG